MTGFQAAVLIASVIMIILLGILWDSLKELHEIKMARLQNRGEEDHDTATGN